MKILIVSQYFYPENFRINDMAQKLQQKGHEISVLTGIPNYPGGKKYEGYSWWGSRRQELNGIEIVRVPLFLRRESRGWQLVVNYLSYVFSACLLGPFVFRGRKFDIIFVPNYSPATVGIPGILMGWLKRAPVFFWVQDLWPQSLSATGAVKSTAVIRLVGAMMNWIYHRCDLIFVQSRAFTNSILELNANPDKIRYLPNWAENLYKPLARSKSFEIDDGFPSDGFKVVFAGNLGEAQSLETIVDAAELVRDHPIHWVILGHGRRFDWMKGQVKDKGLTGCVHLLGSKPMEDMPHYFSHADTMLVTLRPDPIFAATIPGKIQSYLACGRPVIGALDGEGAKVIQDSNSGFSVAAGDAIGLSKAVVKMSEMSRGEHLELGINALAYYKNNFDCTVLINYLEDQMTGQIENGK